MPLYIKDDETARLVAELAKRTGMTKQDAVKSAVRAKLETFPAKPTAREQLEAFYREFPKPEPTGDLADKAFFDDLSGEFD